MGGDDVYHRQGWTDRFFLMLLFFAWYCDHRDLHRVDRRQRQMCIRDSTHTHTYTHIHTHTYTYTHTHTHTHLSPIHISEPTRQAENSYAAFCSQKKIVPIPSDRIRPLHLDPPHRPLRLLLIEHSELSRSYNHQSS